jgi:hypothetical protein
MTGLFKGQQNALEYRLGRPVPVLDAGGHVPAEDEVEGGLVRPGAFDVVDFEFHVGRDPGGQSYRFSTLMGLVSGTEYIPVGLNRTQIISQYLFWTMSACKAHV